MQNVITYQSPNGDTIDLTPTQIATLTTEGRWPKDSRGQEYCSVSHGLHYGSPSTLANDAREIIASLE